MELGECGGVNFMNMRKHISIFLIALSITGLSLYGVAFAKELELSGNVVKHHFAAGDRLPITLKLTNFGYSARVDVTIRYIITDVHDRVILTQSKTVAVETTASFTEYVQLPNQLPSGTYTVKAEIEYAGQDVPGTSSYSFVVERTIFGFFIRDLLLWGSAVTVVLFVVILSRRFRRVRQSSSHDYENIPHEARIYYEIVDDIIRQMRLHDGDAAFKIVDAVPGLSVNKESGKVEDIKGDPAVLTSQLIKSFEEKHNVHINFSITKGSPNLIIRKYKK